MNIYIEWSETEWNGLGIEWIIYLKTNVLCFSKSFPTLVYTVHYGIKSSHCTTWTNYLFFQFLVKGLFTFSLLEQKDNFTDMNWWIYMRCRTMWRRSIDNSVQMKRNILCFDGAMSIYWNSVEINFLKWLSIVIGL